MERNSYGSRADQLPRFMIGLDQARVRKLSLAESRQLESESLNRFPHRSVGGIDWEGIAIQERLWYEDEEAAEQLVRELVSSLAKNGSQVAIFWGTLVLPTVTLPAELAVARAGEIVEVGPEFWIYPIDGQILIECMPDGQVTVAPIPSS